MTLDPKGLVAAEAALRSILAAKSTWMINLNSAVSDQEMVVDMTEVITAYLTHSTPSK